MNKTLQTIFIAVLTFVAGIFTADFINQTPAYPPPLSANRSQSTWGSAEIKPISMPETLSLCGERMPLEDRRVWEMLDREFNINVWDRAQVYMYIKRAGRYFPHIENELAKAGLPDDLKYLAVAESALITHSQSSKGARGPWQFMTLAARSNGLRRDGVIDERLSFERSTEAAIKNLARLYGKFGSWALAMAAYNGGDTRLRKAIRSQKTDNYYRLNLPLETERYVFRIAAIKIIMEDPGRYGYPLSEIDGYQPALYDTVLIKLRKSVNIIDLAQAIGTDFKEIKELNPHFLRDYLPPGRHYLHVPVGFGVMTVDFFKQRTGKKKVAKVISTNRIPRQTH